MTMNTRRSIVKRSTMEQPMPSLDTFIGVLYTTVYKNQGTGNLSKNKMLIFIKIQNMFRFSAK